MADPYMSEVDIVNSNECQACNRLQDLCAYHIGFDDGINYALKQVEELTKHVAS